MPTYRIDSHGHSIILNADETAAGSEDANVGSWSVDDEFILAVQVYYSTCNKTTQSEQFKLQFSEDGGAWTDVGSSTAIAYGTGTTLTDDASTSNQRCTSSVGDCTSGYEGSHSNEGDNTLPDSGGISTSVRQWKEFHWRWTPLMQKAAVPTLFEWLI